MKFVQEETGNPGAYSGIITPARRLESLDRRGGIFDRCEQYYKNERSPLEETFQRYCEFFRLFESFRGYVEFFLLQDLVDPDFSEVRFFLPFDGFNSSPFPSSKEAYLAYRDSNIGFIDARNQRIREYCKTNHFLADVYSVEEGP